MKSERRFKKGQALAGLAGFGLALVLAVAACASPLDLPEEWANEPLFRPQCPVEVSGLCRITSVRVNYFTGHKVIVFSCPNDMTLVFIVTPKGPSI